jgi:hypothetical protein
MQRVLRHAMKFTTPPSTPCAEPVVAEACCSFASLAKNTATPSNRVGLGGTALTVTPVPATVSAKPREIASCAVSVVDHLPLEY